MLKALELSGFKSFADKTRFDFPQGITVVVGPNGSGKSNIVDAIKWVLGEQSAKSLRGKDMSDVIFKGSSGANARKPANSASATIILDNTDGRLMNDAPEIHVTRRVYRSGESEYLINNEPCRLKDIRNLFRGTGVGTEAYSLIEQGKVERMLQASAKDRRAIFEEAAGISRFKAQKVEAERRLERVQTNLTRLADIVEEVGSRFRSIKNQASKAAKYKEYTERLRELRTHVAAVDYRSFSEQISNSQTKIAELRGEVERSKSDISRLTTEHQEAENRVDLIAGEANKFQELIAKIREQISQSESSGEIARQRIADFQKRELELSESVTKLTAKHQELLGNCEATKVALETARSDNARLDAEIQQFEQRLQLLDNESEKITAANQTAETETESLGGLLQNLTQQIGSQSVQVELLRQSQTKSKSRIADLERAAQHQQQLVSEIEARAQDCNQRAESSDSALASARQSLEVLLHKQSELQAEQTELRTDLAGLVQRAKVIEELEKRQEGISSGAQELLRSARQKQTDLRDQVIGLVADLIQVNVQHAAIVDAALGERSQYIVIKDQRLADDLASGQLSVSGRVGILSLDGIYSLGSRLDVDLADVEGVVGSLEAMVDLSGVHSGFVRSLLRGTWIVPDLTTAFKLRKEKSDQVRYVTLSGEVVEADGTLIVGPKSRGEGIVSRRSELRMLAAETEQRKRDLTILEQALATIKSEIKQGQLSEQKLINENQALSKELANLNAQRDVAQRDLKTTQDQLANSRNEYSKLNTELQAAASLLAPLQTDLERHQRSRDSIAKSLQENLKLLDANRTERRDLDQQLTTARVLSAKTEQQIADLELRLRESAASETQTRESNLRAEQELKTLRDDLAESNRILETATTTIQKLADERELQSNEYNRLHGERLELERNRKEIAAQLQKLRNTQHNAEEQLNELNFNAQRLEIEQKQLAERLNEDYGIRVEDLVAQESSEAIENRQDIDREISELRQKLGSMGAVNMQALVELEELENRYQTLDQQYRDLTEARDTLLKIIHRINNDSRRLFTETLEAIRGNFQKLFRQTFGGGQADIILEEGVDVLEAGVEIVATPPGKPKFNNSLLSGGEKALTAVSLLMAIFQFRPSPFCVLDEVDAPFDEANIGRFIDVLKSFLGWTKFVIVTHSKKTMTAATTLYGVTMQESGVSKRVSVRFEDVSEDGEISKDAVKRSESESQPAA
ncbi:MAG: chromosome segregation protein SMC [Pirellulaceae bacterium]|nr:chromosome segregation protein SMC [Pirellulaceae bacterium]